MLASDTVLPRRLRMFRLLDTIEPSGVLGSIRTSCSGVLIKLTLIARPLVLIRTYNRSLEQSG